MAECSRFIQLLPDEPKFYSGRPQNFRREVNEGADRNQKDGKSNNGVVMQERQPADYGRVLAEAERDI